jgi:hypothetical protein
LEYQKERVIELRDRLRKTGCDTRWTELLEDCLNCGSGNNCVEFLGSVTGVTFN